MPIIGIFQCSSCGHSQRILSNGCAIWLDQSAPTPELPAWFSVHHVGDHRFIYLPHPGEYRLAERAGLNPAAACDEGRYVHWESVVCRHCIELGERRELVIGSPAPWLARKSVYVPLAIAGVVAFYLIGYSIQSIAVTLLAWLALILGPPLFEFVIIAPIRRQLRLKWHQKTHAARYAQLESLNACPQCGSKQHDPLHKHDCIRCPACHQVTSNHQKGFCSIS